MRGALIRRRIRFRFVCHLASRVRGSYVERPIRPPPVTSACADLRWPHACRVVGAFRVSGFIRRARRPCEPCAYGRGVRAHSAATGPIVPGYRNTRAGVTKRANPGCWLRADRKRHENPVSSAERYYPFLAASCKLPGENLGNMDYFRLSPWALPQDPVSACPFPGFSVSNDLVHCRTVKHKSYRTTVFDLSHMLRVEKVNNAQKVGVSGFTSTLTVSNQFSPPHHFPRE